MSAYPLIVTILILNKRLADNTQQIAVIVIFPNIAMRSVGVGAGHAPTVFDKRAIRAITWVFYSYCWHIDVLLS